MIDKAKLEARRDALKADTGNAKAHLEVVTAAAAVPLQRRDRLRHPDSLVISTDFTSEERQQLAAHAGAQNRLVALEDELKAAERELGKADSASRAVTAGDRAECGMAKAEARVKTTGAHLTKVQQLKAVKTAELDIALRQQRQAEEDVARATVKALLAGEAPPPSPTTENAAVGRLEALLAQIEVSLADAQREHADAEQALADLAVPIWHGRYQRSRDALREAVENLLPHLDAFMAAQRALGWGYHLPDEADLDIQLRRWREGRG